MKVEFRYSRLIIFLLALLVLAGCSGCSSTSTTDFSALVTKLEEGDLLFRKGTGVVGHIVTSVDNRGDYSHVGIVVRNDCAWQVVHAVPHEPDFKGDIDRVKIESVERFLGRYPEASFGHYRVKIGSDSVAIAVANALRLSEQLVPFDHDYDLSDTSSLYCTEFVEYIYSLAGIELSEGRRTELFFPSLSGNYIMPSDLTESAYLEPIY
jgi:hypothetical protein